MIKEIIKTIQWIRESKGLKNYLIFTITVFFGLFSSYGFAQTTGATTTTSADSASNSVCIDASGSFVEQTKFTGINGGEENPLTPNMWTTSDNKMLAVPMGLVFQAMPQVSCEYENIKTSSLNNFSKNGLIGSINNGIAGMVTSSPNTDLVAHLGGEWVPGFDKAQYASYAANDGYTFLMEINADNLWDKMRTVAYILFVIVLIVAGFMIMFRQKIGGQVAVTVFNALPNVIMGLIFVTFSFAIVGLILNVSTMLINVMGGLLDPTGKSLIAVNNPFSLVSGLWKPLFDPTVSANFTGAGLTTAASSAVTAALAFFAGFNVLSGGMLAVSTIIAFIIPILIIISIFTYASVRVYITVLSAYLGILLDTILAPVILAVSSFPGQQGLGKDWLNRVLRNALTFPIVFFFTNLGIYILKGDINISFPHGLTAGNIAAADTDNGAIGMLFRSLIVLLMMFFAADAPKMLTDFLPSNQGKGIAEALGGFKKGLSKIPVVGSMLG